MPSPPKAEVNRPAIALYVLLAAALLGFIQAFSLLSPILLSLLLIVLISLAVNPLVFRLRTWTGGRRGAAAWGQSQILQYLVAA